MRRRDFIKVIAGSAAATWPLLARAQQGERARRIGVLMNVPENEPNARARFAAFLQGMQQLGWADGRNIRIDTRWGGNDAKMRKNAAELVALAPEIIVAAGQKKWSPGGLGDQFSKRMYARAAVWSRSGRKVHIIRHKKGPLDTRSMELERAAAHATAPVGRLGSRGLMISAPTLDIIPSAALGFGATNMSVAELYGAYVVASLSRQAQERACRFHSALPSYGCRSPTERGWLGA